MAKFKFIDKVPVEAYIETEVIVEAETLVEAKEKILKYYANGNEPKDFDETDDIKINRRKQLHEGDSINTCVCVEDNTETDYGVFKHRK